MDQVQQAIDRATRANDFDQRSRALQALVVTPPDDHHRKAVVARAVLLLRDPTKSLGRAEHGAVAPSGLRRVSQKSCNRAEKMADLRWIRNTSE